MKMKPFEEEARCAACRSNDVAMRFRAGYPNGWIERLRLDRIECYCRRCGLEWTMEPAWAPEKEASDED